MTRAITVDKAHGRIKTRRIAVRPPPARLNQLWPDVGRICRIERIREMKTYCERQVIYVITSLPPELADAVRLLEIARDHWQIENGLHRVKDGAFAEDACKVRSGNAPFALAVVRNRALAIIRKKALRADRVKSESICSVNRLVKPKEKERRAVADLTRGA